MDMMPATNPLASSPGSTDGSNHVGSGLDPTRTVIILVDLINWQAAPDSAVIKSIRAALSKQ